jgi:peptide deformylase
MRTLEIKKYGCDILKNVAEPISKITDELKTIIDDMIQTMYHNNGIGLAAPQVGYSYRIIIIDTEYPNTNKKNPIVMINPVIVAFDDEKLFEEGCLSIPNVFVNSNRFKKITTKFFDINLIENHLDSTETQALAIQHEIDHLDGKLCIDRLNPLKKMGVSFKLNKISSIGSSQTNTATYLM